MPFSVLTPSRKFREFRTGTWTPITTLFFDTLYTREECRVRLAARDLHLPQPHTQRLLRARSRDTRLHSLSARPRRLFSHFATPCCPAQSSSCSRASWLQHAPSFRSLLSCRAPSSPCPSSLRRRRSRCPSMCPLWSRCRRRSLVLWLWMAARVRAADRTRGKVMTHS